MRLTTGIIACFDSTFWPLTIVDVVMSEGSLRRLVRLGGLILCVEFIVVLVGCKGGFVIRCTLSGCWDISMTRVGLYDG